MRVKFLIDLLVLALRLVKLSSKNQAKRGFFENTI